MLSFAIFLTDTVLLVLIIKQGKKKHILIPFRITSTKGNAPQSHYFQQ